MKVVHLNTGIRRSSAPYRLHEALRERGIESKILVLNAGEKLNEVYPVRRSLFYKCKRKIYSLLRQQVLKRFQPTEYMPFTALPVGMNLDRQEVIREADIICLHWVCGDFMSPETIRKILKLGKPVLMACHDNYSFTGGCHVRLGCERYQTGCGRCPQLCVQRERDITSRLAKKKKRIFHYPNLYVLSPSRWMDHNVEKSAVLGGHRHFILPNAIDTHVFRPYKKEQVRAELGLDREGFVVLAGLKANEKIPYNGTSFLWEMFQKLDDTKYRKRLGNQKIQAVVFGVEQLEPKCSLPMQNLGYITDENLLAKVYSAADVYVITSLEDSFNQTAAECMACGTPVAAFCSGGIADVIDHRKNGYLAEYKNIDDLMEGIIFANGNHLGEAAREKIEEQFSFKVIGEKFIHIAEQINHGM